jgi:hypothetical protein
VTAPSRPIATTPSSGTLKGRDPGGSAPGDGERLGEAFGFRDEGAVGESGGTPLASEAVVPNGVGEIPGEAEVPVPGTAVAGTEVGLGVGFGVGLGLAVGAAVGAMTTTGLTVIGVGFGPLALIALKVTAQLPLGSFEEPVQVPWLRFPPVFVRGTETPATDAVTLLAVVVPL